MRNINFHNGGFYHVYNRGIDKRKIFKQKLDYKRFINSLFLFNISLRNKKHSIREYELKTVLNNNPYVKIHSFCLMQNHFHLLLEQVVDEGISKFMQRLGNGYTKYFNAKYKRKGRLLSGPYQIKEINSIEYLCHISRYIHCNPAKLSQNNKEQFIKKYPWSSFSEYINNTQSLIASTEEILSYFKDSKQYLKYVLDLLNVQHPVLDVGTVNASAGSNKF